MERTTGVAEGRVGKVLSNNQKTLHLCRTSIFKPYTRGPRHMFVAPGRLLRTPDPPMLTVLHPMIHHEKLLSPACGHTMHNMKKKLTWYQSPGSQADNGPELGEP